MKKGLVFIAALLMSVGAMAQGKYMVVNSEEIFKSVDDYNAAQSQIETLSQKYQKSIDNSYSVIEKTYNDYMQRKAYMTETQRKAQEEAIIEAEKSVEKQQQSYFGPEGEVMKKRQELIKPIQERIQGIIKNYATQNGFDMVMDASGNESIIYFDPMIDKTKEIIKLVK